MSSGELFPHAVGVNGLDTNREASNRLLLQLTTAMLRIGAYKDKAEAAIHSSRHRDSRFLDNHERYRQDTKSIKSTPNTMRTTMEFER